MRHKVVLKILGVLLTLFSTTQLPPVIVALIYDEHSIKAFVLSGLLTLLTGILCWLPVRNFHRDLKFRDGFLVVALFWTVVALFGSLPFLLTEEVHISVTDAFFESMSGLTTTGATVMTGLDELPRSILYYRQQLQWLGGMGIIVLAVAVMPMLGVGGMQLYRAETPGPVKNSKLTPRITQTAKALWLVYTGLTVACALGYYVAGMNVFDAIGHSFATIASGGFSTHDSSLGFYNSPQIAIVATVFMIFSGINFGLHFMAFRNLSVFTYFRDPEARGYLLFVFAIICITLATLLATNAYSTIPETIWQGIFQVVSMGTTTGFATTGFSWWPTFLPVMLVIMSAVGGCAGSTSGGMKVIRLILLYKQGRREIHQLIHPQAVISIKLGNKPVPNQVINSVWGYLALYILSYVTISIAMSATGADLITAFSSVTACLNNLGPGLGEVTDNYASVTVAGKWLLSFTMLLGRLELFTLLVLFSRSYWRS
ncbi:MAG: Trk system potassium uptake protein [marine bacterium B5-7]|nr:MAG: Trk system potassium uptake protein [marine bacterium B5-7]